MAGSGSGSNASRPAAEQLAGFQRRHHGLLVDDVAARRVDQDRAALHAGEDSWR